MRERHPAVKSLLNFFEYGHLPDDLKYPSKKVSELVEVLMDSLNDGPEFTAGLRKLLEAKDCFVRQALLDRECNGS